MELAGLIRCWENLDKQNIVIDTFISDRHTSITSWVKAHRSTTTHYYDLWHIAKSLNKNLHKASKTKGFEVIGMWKKPIKKHLYWCVTTTQQGFSALVLAKWQSVIRHISNVHTEHPSPLFPKCLHGELSYDRAWIPEGLYF